MPAYTWSYGISDNIKYINEWKLPNLDDFSKDYVSEFRIREMDIGDTVYHTSYGKGTIVEFDIERESAYLVKFENPKKYFKDGKWWSNKKSLDFNAHIKCYDYSAYANKAKQSTNSTASASSSATATWSGTYRGGL